MSEDRDQGALKGKSCRGRARAIGTALLSLAAAVLVDRPCSAQLIGYRAEQPDRVDGRLLGEQVAAWLTWRKKVETRRPVEDPALKAETAAGLRRKAA